jgi:hypothetical protein
MATIDLNAATVERPGDRFERDEAELAAASFLARHSGRTLEPYRHDLRGFFHWAADNHLEVLKATRRHIELFRAWMDDRQLATCNSPPARPTPEPPRSTTTAAKTSTATPPTSSSPSSPAAR